MPQKYKVLSRPSDVAPPNSETGSGSIPAAGSAWEHAIVMAYEAFKAALGVQSERYTPAQVMWWILLVHHNKGPRPSVTFEDEHRPCVQTYKAVWRDSDDERGHEAGFSISPMLQKWITEAMEHIYNGGPPPTMEPYVGHIGPRVVTSPNNPTEQRP